MVHMGRHFRSRMALAVVVAALFATACGDDAANRQSATFQPARLPVVLQSDVRITVAPDGSNLREEPITGFESGADPTVSPDGTLQVVADNGTVRVQPLDGGDATVVEGVRVPSDATLNVIWSPRGDRILFDAATDGTSALYLVRADGGGLADVAAGLDGDAFPLAWASDGSRLAFGLFGGDDTAPRGTLYVTDADGARRVEAGDFVHPQGDAGWDRPRFSPDAARIAAFAMTPAGLSLRVFDPGGGPPIDLGGDGVLKFSWSPDSRSLAFDRTDYETGRSSISIWDMASGTTRELTEGHWPRWSPDGDVIAFKRESADGIESQIYTVHADGSGEVAIGTRARYAFQELTWSDDGAELTYVRPAFSAAQLYRVDLAAGIAEAVGVPIGDAGNPPRSVSLSPDASDAVYLVDAFEPGGTWQVIELATGAPRTLVANGFPFADVYWTDDGPRVALGGTSASITDPGGSEPRSLETGMAQKVVFSPDGSELAVLMVGTLLIASVDGPERQVLYQGEAPGDIVQDVDWAPSGDRFTFTVSRTDPGGAASTSTFLADLAGNVEEIDNKGGYAGLAYWSPDGETLAQIRKPSFNDPNQLWLLDAGGDNARILAENAGVCCEQLYWSPDGTRIAVSRDLSSVVLIDVVSGTVTTAITTGGGCNVSIAGWSADGGSLYAYPACYTGI